MVGLHDRVKSQQYVLQMLQRQLKEAQSPALPEETERREAFAAGMAAGYNLLSLLEERKSIGVENNQQDFLSGIHEAVQGGKRLDSHEFKTLLNSITQKVASAETKAQQTR